MDKGGVFYFFAKFDWPLACLSILFLATVCDCEINLFGGEVFGLFYQKMVTFNALIVINGNS